MFYLPKDRSLCAISSYRDLCLASFLQLLQYHSPDFLFAQFLCISLAHIEQTTVESSSGSPQVGHSTIKTPPLVFPYLNLSIVYNWFINKNGFRLNFFIIDKI